jgi:hypothetical protein
MPKKAVSITSSAHGGYLAAPRREGARAAMAGGNPPAAAWPPRNTCHDSRHSAQHTQACGHHYWVLSFFSVPFVFRTVFFSRIWPGWRFFVADMIAQQRQRRSQQRVEYDLFARDVSLCGSAPTSCVRGADRCIWPQFHSFPELCCLTSSQRATNFQHLMVLSLPTTRKWTM